MREKTYLIKLRTGKVFDVKFENKEAVRRWLTTGAAGILPLRGNKMITPESIVSITGILSCPKCGSEDVHKTGFASGVGSGPNLSTSPEYDCRNCGKRFRRSDAQKEREVYDLAEKALNAISQLKATPSTENLRGYEVLKGLEKPLREFQTDDDKDKLHQNLDPFMTSSIAKPEGYRMGSSIWDAEIILDGKATWLEEILSDLRSKNWEILQ